MATQGPRIQAGENVAPRTDGAIIKSVNAPGYEKNLK